MFINAEDQKWVIKAEVNYKKWLFCKIKDFLGQRVLEVGCGVGAITQFLIDRDIVVAIDNDELCIKALEKRFQDNRNIVPVRIGLVDNNIAEQLLKYDFDTIICLNVLEHIKDDKKGLANIYNLLHKRGRLILLVPAYPFLFGIGDIIVWHYRRYQKKALKAMLEEAGFKIERSFFMHITGIIGWFFHNKIMGKREGFFEVSLYDKLIIPLVSKLEEIIRFPFGLSLVFICRRGL